MFNKAIINYFIHFHTDRDYFECHEIVEEFWMEDDIPNRKRFLVGLIQIAVGMYHYRRNNLVGAGKMFKSALAIVENEVENIRKIGLLTEELLIILQNQLQQINLKIPYQSIQLPLQSDLIEICLQQCLISHLNWGQESDLSNVYLINKHCLRDRTEIINTRNNLLKSKSQSSN